MAKAAKHKELFDFCGKGENGSNLAPLKVACYVTNLLRPFYSCQVTNTHEVGCQIPQYYIVVYFCHMLYISYLHKKILKFNG
jgi:hypothetical protein